MQQSYGDVGTPSPTTVHRTHPQGDGAHTLPRRTNAHFAAGHMGPALQGTPVMQDGTSGRRPLQRFIVPIRRGRCPHIAPPDKCAFCGGTHGSRPTGYAGHAGRDVGTPPPTTAHRTRPQEVMPTSPRRTNAHFAAGHRGPALQGTPVMQDGTSGRRPLQRFIVPIRRGRCPHIAPPDKCAFCGGTHGSRPTGYAGHAGRDVGTPSPTTVYRTHP